MSSLSLLYFELYIIALKNRCQVEKFTFIKSIYMNAARFRKETSLQSHHNITIPIINWVWVWKNEVTRLPRMKDASKT